MKIPRVMLAAVASGSGKTLLTCAMIGALKEVNKDVVSYKCGPDYIDPMFHRTILGIPSENLDTFFMEEEQVRQTLCTFSKGHDISIIEGVMGLYDGLAGTKEIGSSYHLAKVTKTPIILVVDAHGMGRTMIPIMKGMLAYDTEHLIRGIIINRISAMYFETLKPMLQAEVEVPVIGIFENNKDLHIESRHLGLKMPEEITNLREELFKASQQFRQTVDMDLVIQIADGADELYADTSADKAVEKRWGKIAVARDEAFCFYYEANLRLLEEMGYEIVFFSPIHDLHMPSGISGIYLGGGYPELYAKELSQNESLKTELWQCLNSDIPSIAECGGFLYLHKAILVEKTAYPMVGIIDAIAENKQKLVRFGYVEVQEKDSLLLKQGKKIKGHEFHYYDSTANGEDFIISKPYSKRNWTGIHRGAHYMWGFAHLYWPSCPELIENIFCK